MARTCLRGCSSVENPERAKSTRGRGRSLPRQKYVAGYVAAFIVLLVDLLIVACSNPDAESCFLQDDEEANSGAERPRKRASKKVSRAHGTDVR